MPRKPRESSGTGIYHVMLRGINRQDIFDDNEDYWTFIRMMSAVPCGIKGTGPCKTTYYNMWDAQQTGTGNITTATKKTIYDPCPAGFCVPTGNLYYFMGDGGSRPMGTGTWDDANKGATWDISTTGNNLFFPASSCRIFESGTLYYVGSRGYCWSASPASGSNGHVLGFESGNWYWGDSNQANGFPVRACGFPVRAVAEE